MGFIRFTQNKRHCLFLDISFLYPSMMHINDTIYPTGFKGIPQTPTPTWEFVTDRPQKWHRMIGDKVKTN